MTLFRFLSQNAPWLGAGALLTFLSSFGQTFFISIFAGEIRTTFGLSHGQWGGIYSLGTGLSAIAMIWAGALTDLFRVRVLGPVILAGLAMACLAMALNPVAWALPIVIFALRFFGQGMTSHTAVVAMSRWFSATRGRALSVASLGFSLGEAVMPVLFVSLLVWTDWHILWMAAAAICVLAIPALILLLRRERTPQSMAEGQSSVGMAGRHWKRAEALRHPLFWFMVPALLGPSAFNTAFFFHQVHFAEIKGWSHGALVSLFPIYTGLAIVAMLASGWAIDRWGTARLMPFIQLPMVAAFLLFSAAEGLDGALLAFLFLAMTTGANATCSSAFWAEFYGTAYIGAIKALAAAIMVFGSAAGPGITGALIDHGIGLERQFIGIAAYFAVTTVLMLLGVARFRGDLPPR